MAHRKLVAAFLFVFAGLVLGDVTDQANVFTRFEYKHSFKGPHLVDRKGRVPFWTSHGNTMASNDQVRLTPSIRSMKGSLWNNIEYASDRWSVEVWLRVTGRGSVGGDGMAIWFRDQPGEAGNVFGVSDKWTGMGLILDSYDNDGGQDNPMISLVMNDGSQEYDHNTDGRLQLSGQCKRDFRNRAHPVRLRIQYLQGQLRVEYDAGTAGEPLYEVCLIGSDVKMPSKGYFGVSAATGGLADDHDVLRFLTTTISDKSFVTGDVPTLQKEDVTKAQDMYDRFSVDLEKQKEEYAKENPQVVLQDESLVYQTPLERSVSQILEGMQEIRELTKNLHSTVVNNAVAGSPTPGQQQQQQWQQPNPGATEAMISQSLAHMSQEVKQLMRRNQDETNSILRLHSDGLRRLEGNTMQGGPGGAEVPAINENLVAQRAQIEAVGQRLAALQNDLASRASGSSDSSDCLSYTTVTIVVVLEALICLALHVYQRRVAAAAEKKFF